MKNYYTKTAKEFLASKGIVWNGDIKEQYPDGSIKATMTITKDGITQEMCLFINELEYKVFALDYGTNFQGTPVRTRRLIFDFSSEWAKRMAKINPAEVQKRAEKFVREMQQKLADSIQLIKDIDATKTQAEDTTKKL